MTTAALPTPARHDPEAFVLPHSVEAERATLGAALISATAADYIADALTPEAYFRRAHQTLFAAVQALRGLSVEVDTLTLRDHLLKTGALDAVGGAVYLSALTDGVPRSTNVAHYAAILRDLQVKRAIVAYAKRTIDLVAAATHSGDAIVADSDRRLMELQAGHTDGRMESLAASSRGLYLDLEWRCQHQGELTGVTTGFASIDELTLGWQAGDLVVIGARPSIGKTTFAVNSAVHAARAGKRVAIFSLEMRRRQLEYRILAQLSNVPLTRILGGHLGSAEMTATSEAM